MRITLTAALLISIPVYTQGDDALMLEAQQKIEKYDRVVRAGNTLLGTGIALLAAGAVLLPAGFAVAGNDDDKGAVMIAFGAYSLAFGAPLTIAGGVVRAVGKRKHDESALLLTWQLGL